ncbi:ParA family protein [Sphingobium sp. HWE2-09]|uniref:ParA family protein n=1 Tax=Sphingobium sp. HWE2-09 TaxID=3108390 RepID=UPI002DCFA610|nr:AAA family ATPase [Sphingobium sp. HWE2-09]
MKVVSVINYKGGVGKTSLTANLGAELAWRGKRVLLLDLDAQASLTFSFISAEEWSRRFAPDRTIKAWYDSFDAGQRLPLQSIIEKPERVGGRLSGRGTLDIIYSHLGLINVDLELATQIGGANLSQARRNFLSVHKRLLVGLNDPVLENNYDICLIDCPPNFNIVTKTAIVASKYILVPTKPDQLSTLGIDYLRRSIRQLVDDYNEFVKLEQGDLEPQINPKIAGVVFTMIQEYGGSPISAQRTYMHKIAQDSGLRVFNSYITRNDTMFAGAPEYGVPVVLNGASNYSHQKVVDGIEQVTTEFMEVIKL